jgi:CBS domain-containing protein
LVLDDQQHLVGILSATDIAQRLDEQSLLSDS